MHTSERNRVPAL